MAKMRKFSAYRNLVGPAYTRTSRYRAKSFIRMNKNPRIVRWNMGTLKDYEYVLRLLTTGPLQIRDNAIESMRQVSNRVMEKKLGIEEYYLHIRVYPHQILRMNALAAGAGADRLSTGMGHPFGKSIGVAARLKKGQPILEIFCNKNGLELARDALRRAKTKLPGSYKVTQEIWGKHVQGKSSSTTKE